MFDPTTPEGFAISQALPGLLGGGGSAQRMAGATATFAEMMQRERAKKLLEERERQMMAEREQQMKIKDEEHKLAQEKAARAQQDEGIARRLFGQQQQMGMPGAEMGPAMPERTGGMINPQTFLAQGGSMGALGGVADLNKMLMPAPRKLTTVSPGSSVIDENDPTKALFTAKEKESAPPEIVRLMAERDKFPPGSQGWQIIDAAIKKATTHAPAASAVSYSSPMAGVDAQGNPVFFQPSNRGGAASIVPGVTPPKKDPTEKPLTEAQAKAATFQSQMISAEKELQTVPIDQTKLWSQIDTSMATGPLNIAASPAAQRARQAQEQWSESFLRFKTGAAATEDEVKRNVRTYFPQPGDSRDVLLQKARMREQAVADLGKAAAHGAVTPTTGKTVKRTGTQNGRKVVEYSDGSIEYAD
jgi:hypothetical protein